VATKFDSLKITYENILLKRDETAETILKYLDVDHTIPLKTPIVKINSDDLKDVIENYKEVYTALKNSPYEKYLY